MLILSRKIESDSLMYKVCYMIDIAGLFDFLALFTDIYDLNRLIGTHPSPKLKREVHK